MAERELNRSERAAIRKLVTELCANYDSQDKICLPLDSSCYMLNKWWTGAYCRYFEKSVLPVDAALESAITGEDTSMRQKICPVCGKAYPVSYTHLDGAKSVCSGGSTEGATLCAWVQGMQYPCAGQGRQPCPVKWRFAT